jgi:hypothetical protein
LFIARAPVALAATTSFGPPALLAASDGTAGDGFGSAVAIDGSLAVVGAVGRAGGGAAYIFAFESGTWSQQAELTAADAAPGDEFGTAVAISGSTVVVGAPARNSNIGAAYVFSNGRGGWSQRAELSVANGATQDRLGTVVAISGSTVIVGAPGTGSNAGAAYAFVANGNTWSLQAQLTTAPAASPNDAFGASVALSGTTAVIGSPGEGSYTGAAYVFVLTARGWQQQSRLAALDASPQDEFGNAVAISGSSIVVAAYAKTVGGVPVAGAVYVFAHRSMGWFQQAELTASNPEQRDLLGASVAISGATVLAGTYTKNSYAGAAYLFERSGGDTWSQKAEFTGDAPYEYFGFSVAVSGHRALVGAFQDDGNGVRTGAAYAFNP